MNQLRARYDDLIDSGASFGRTPTNDAPQTFRNSSVMYIARRVRDTAAIENIDTGSSAGGAKVGSGCAGSVRFNVYNSTLDTDADSRRHRAHRHRHAHR
jgi:hypothetical protein